MFTGVGLKLVDFKVEFGRLWEEEDMRIVLADEISPDNCRLWDSRTNEKLDKDRFRRDLGNVQEGYAEIARRLGILPEAGPRDIRGRRRCSEGAGRDRLPTPASWTPRRRRSSRALGSLGFGGVRGVRRTKVIELDLGRGPRRRPRARSRRCASGCSPTR